MGPPLAGARGQQGCASQSSHVSQKPNILLYREAGRDLGEEFEQFDEQELASPFLEGKRSQPW